MSPPTSLFFSPPFPPDLSRTAFLLLPPRPLLLSSILSHHTSPSFPLLSTILFLSALHFLAHILILLFILFTTLYLCHPFPHFPSTHSLTFPPPIPSLSLHPFPHFPSTHSLTFPPPIPSLSLHPFPHFPSTHSLTFPPPIPSLSLHPFPHFPSTHSLTFPPPIPSLSLHPFPHFPSTHSLTFPPPIPSLSLHPFPHFPSTHSLTFPPPIPSLSLHPFPHFPPYPPFPSLSLNLSSVYSVGDNNKYEIHLPLPPKIDPTVTMMQVRMRHLPLNLYTIPSTRWKRNQMLPTMMLEVVRSR